MTLRDEILASGIGGKAEPDYRMLCQDGKYLEIPVYLPEHGMAVFIKSGMRSLSPELATRAVHMGLRAANVASLEELRACLEGDAVGKAEMYVPVSVPSLPRSRTRSRAPTDDESRVTAGNARYFSPGRDGFSEADRKRMEDNISSLRARLERRTGKDLSGSSLEELHALMREASLRRSYQSEPDIDGDFDKSRIDDC